MVIVMRLNHSHKLNDKNKYLHQESRQSLRSLHKLYASEQVDVPSVEDIILRMIRLGKGFSISLKDYLDDDNTDKLFELCMLIGDDFEDVEAMFAFSGGDVLDV